jgi:peptidyl-prolyl cis-trans isomerase C
MKHTLSLLILLSAVVWAQAPVSSDTVVAEVNGQKLTAGDIETAVSGAPPEIKRNFDTNRKEFLQQYALMLRLVEMAEKAKLDERSPYKQQLEWTHNQVLMQAQITEYGNHINVLPEEMKRFYEANREHYQQAKLKVIYIPFASTPPPQTDPKAKKVMTEAEAKAKAESLLEQIRQGADFVKLVKEHSEDPTSVAKNGDFGAIHRSDNIPEVIKQTVFALKPGEVSAPVRQANGYYLFRVEETGTRPYEEVKGELEQQVRQQRFREWFESVRKSVDVKYENETYFSAPPAK